MAGRVMVRQRLSSLSRWFASRQVATWSENPGCLASKVDANGSDGAGTVRGVNAFCPALGPMAMR